MPDLGHHHHFGQLRGPWPHQCVELGGAGAPQLDALMRPWAPKLTEVVVVPEVGHWVQQEAADATNRALLDFLNTLDLKEQ